MRIEATFQGGTSHPNTAAEKQIFILVLQTTACKQAAYQYLIKVKAMITLVVMF